MHLECKFLFLHSLTLELKFLNHSRLAQELTFLYKVVLELQFLSNKKLVPELKFLSNSSSKRYLLGPSRMSLLIVEVPKPELCARLLVLVVVVFGQRALE